MNIWKISTFRSLYQSSTPRSPCSLLGADPGQRYNNHQYPIQAFSFNQKKLKLSKKPVWRKAILCEQECGKNNVSSTSAAPTMKHTWNSVGLCANRVRVNRNTSINSWKICP